ncbi:hypothetical protein [Ohtaekwangia koreensis]|uniref:Uncharacterized protein n=1 Tax=Ohtaekwangia koreensis TaxID=688867 RepID=A0A1T5M5K6_9BACT|nr:hypothetical protein [Ohtaekwangia koreensis]SKC83324.1 hypothetical protein SAMN05660236_4421 [Ohtaekwangia koreensis]
MIGTFKSFVQDIPSFGNLYHDVVTEQHKQCYFYNRMHDFSRAGEQNRKNFLPLNQANLNLGRFCKRTVDTLKDSCDDQQVVSELSLLVKQWQDYYNEGGTFDTYRYAASIFERLRAIGYPVYERLKAERELLVSFLQVPFVTKAFFQINILVAETDLYSFFQHHFTSALQRPSLHYYIKEMTVNSSFLIVTHQDRRDKYAILKFILLPGIINSVKNPVIHELIESLIAPFSTEDIPSTMHPYSARHTGNVFVSQGSTNYKKFLDLLGLIDAVYHPEENFAYLKN